MIKKIFRASVLLVLVLVISSSCAKKTVPPAPPVPEMSALVGNYPWKATDIKAKKVSANSDSIMITGHPAGIDDYIFYLTIASPIPGSYQIGSTSNLVGYAGFTDYYGSTGTVVIASCNNNYVTGTFNSYSERRKSYQTKGTFTAKIE